MMNSEDQLIMKTVELLEKEGLFAADELSMMEDYLCGETGDETLGKFGFQDLSNIKAPAEIYRKYTDLLNKERGDVADRLGKLLFAIGEASCHKIFPLTVFDSKYRRLELEPAQAAAVYAAVLGESGYTGRFRKDFFENLVSLATHKPENLKKAMDYRGLSSNGRLVLLAVYFVIKYPATKPQKEEKGLAAEMGKPFDMKNSQPEIQIEEEDTALMKQYEEILIGSIPLIYQGSLPKPDMDDLMNAVSDDKVDERILELAASRQTGEYFQLHVTGTTAFMNFALSPCLKNIVSICYAASDAMFDAVEGLDMRDDLSRLRGRLDVVFRVDCVRFTAWAARRKDMAVLKEQFGRNQEAFLKYMDAADYDTYNLMASVLNDMDPALFRKKMSGGKKIRQDKLIGTFVQEARQAGDNVRKYLGGEGGIDIVYKLKDALADRYYWCESILRVLKKYQKNYGYDSLSNRCETLLLATNGCCFYSLFVKNNGAVPKEIKRMFAVMDGEGLNLVTQLNVYAYLAESNYSEKWMMVLEAAAKEVFQDYLTRRKEEMQEAFRNAGSVGRAFGLHVLAENKEQNKEVILSFSQDTAKSVKEVLLEILYQQKGWDTELCSLLSSKKAADRETAIKVMARWRADAKQSVKDTPAADQEASVEKYTQILTQALEKEKNAKVRTLLENELGISAEESGSRAATQGDLVKELHKGNRKRALAWAYETPFSKVHKKDGTEAEEGYLQAIFLCYSTMSPCGVSKSAESLAEALDKREFAVYVDELFDKWIEAGAESKKRWVLYVAAIHGGDNTVNKIHRQIQEWPQAARGAIASEAVQALALSPLPQALLVVDGISRKFKFKQVKAAAAKAFEFAASQLGITTEELADRIVPSLGFDENMQRIFDYGQRKFTVAITTTLEIEVFDGNGKKLKNLPAPGKKDDETKAAEAYEEFKQIKKQMKATVSSQKMRLEMALSTGRQWNVRAWKELFVKNPIMHQFAIGLIWGIYEDGKLVSGFRYMEDEEEFTLPEAGLEKPDGQDQAIDPLSGKCAEVGRDAVIRLVHPIELSADSIKAWKEQLEDYEITQPIEQLDRPVCYKTEEEKNQKALERFGGVIVNDLSLGGKLTAFGWYRGEVVDGGCFCAYYREDKELGLGAVLHFSGAFVGGGNEDVTIYEIMFFHTGKSSTWNYDKETDVKFCLLSEVPEQYFSEIILQVSRATASSTGQNENWKKKK